MVARAKENRLAKERIPRMMGMKVGGVNARQCGSCNTIYPHVHDQWYSPVCTNVLCTGDGTQTFKDITLDIHYLRG